METFRPIPYLNRKLRHLFPFIPAYPLQMATIVFLGSIGFIMAIALAWLKGEKNISAFFAYLHTLQNNPPFWVEVPEFTHPFYLYIPTIVGVLIVTITMKKSSKPQTWSKVIVVSLLMAFTLRYFFWRCFSSLNFASPLDGIFSLLLLVTEAIFISRNLSQAFLFLSYKKRHKEADIYSKAVISGDYQPSVDILIPTYNEPAFILKRSIIGCQAMDYANKQIYLLDDTRRKEIKQLAVELGCHYITRSDNSHAKAGNLNHALMQTQGELITVFDADFVPTANFLTRTIGFFQNRKIAIVQTCQEFYNADAVAYNLGLENELNAEDDFFHCQMQPILDGAGFIICAGSSFVVRRQALEEVGGFYTESLSEDYYTGIMITARGYQVVYLNEKLSAGLAPETITAYLVQKARWAQGTMQSFFIKANSLTIPGLNFRQRFVNFDGLIGWLVAIPQVFVLTIPLFWTFFDVRPLIISPEESLYIFLPYYCLQFITFYWMCSGVKTLTITYIYDHVKIFYIALAITQIFLDPFGKGFRVTPKGILHQKSYFHWKIAIPLIILWLINLVSLGKSLIHFTFVENNIINLVFFWSFLNFFLLSISIIALVNRPKKTHYQWFNLHESVCLISKNTCFEGVTQRISEAGLIIDIPQKGLNSLLCFEQFSHINLTEKNLSLAVKINNIESLESVYRVTLYFDTMTLDQERRLIELLFCAPDRWPMRKVAGEGETLLMLIKVVIKPFILGFKTIVTQLNPYMPKKKEMTVHHY